MKKNVSNKKKFLVKMFSVLFAVAIAFCSCGFLFSSFEDNNCLKVSASDISQNEFRSDLLFNSYYTSSPSDLISCYFKLGSFSGGGKLQVYNSNFNVLSTAYSFSSSDNFLYFQDFTTWVNEQVFVCIFLSFDNLSSFGSLVSSTYYRYPILEFDGVNVILNDVTPIGYMDYEFVNGHIYYFQYFQGNSDYVVFPPGTLEPSEPTIIDSYITVWNSIFSWIITSINSVLTLFYLNGELTVFGVLAVIALSIAIFFLCVHLILKFIHFRGN